MIDLREDVFETNSSGTHAVTITSSATYDRWENGEVFFIEESEKFIEPSKMYEYTLERLNKEIANYEEYLKETNKDTEYYRTRLEDVKKDLADLPAEEDFTKAFNSLMSKYEHIAYDYEDLEELEEGSTEYTVASIIENYVGATFTENGYYEFYEIFEGFNDEKNIDGVDVKVFGYYGYGG